LILDEEEVGAAHIDGVFDQDGSGLDEQRIDVLPSFEAS